MYGKSSLLLPFLASAVFASVPSEQCRGSCTVVQPATDSQVPSTIHIDGPSHAVSDLTPASGWEVLGCPSDWSKGSVDVRVVCTDVNPEASCHHIHEQGAEHTVVMLPLSCGTGPFARVARWQVARDQRIPAGSAAEHKIRRRNLTPEVFEARLDYDFRAIPEARGPISFDIVGSHHPDINAEIGDAKSVPHVLRRALSSDAEAAAQQIAAIPTATDDLFGITIPSVTIPHITIPTIPSISIPSISIPSISIPSISIPSISIPSISIPSITIPHISFPDLPSIDIPLPTSFPLPDLGAIKSGIEKSKGFEAVNLQKNVTLLNESLGCQLGKIGFDQSATVNVDADILINAAYAFKIAGSLTPPGVTDFALAGALSGRINATLDIEMYLSADIMLPSVQLLGLGIPGLSIPGLFTIGPEVALKATIDLSVDVAFSADIPMMYDFDRLDFVLPTSLAPSGSSGQPSHKQSSMQMNVSPGDQTGSIGFHLIPRIEFGLDILDGWAGAEAYVGIDADITFNSNGTIYPDFSYDGCQDISVGAEASVGVTASAFKFLNTGDSIPLFNKRDVLWQHCSQPGDGPTTAILANGDGTYTNANGDLVNVNGQLIDDSGNVIPDDDAADLDPPPVKDDQGNDIPDGDLILDNLDSTFEDAWGNATNSVGQMLSFNGTVMGCDVDTTNLTDANGAAISPEDMIIDVGEGIFSNNQCQLVNEDGSLVDELGNIIDYEPFLADDGSVMDPTNVTIDNEDGTFNDPFGNPVDLWGNAMDLTDLGDVIQVALTPDTDDGSQQDADAVDSDDPSGFSIMSPDQLETLVVNLLHGTAPSGGTTATPTSTPGATTSAPTTDSAPTTSAPVTTDSAPGTSAPATSDSAPATTDSAPDTSSDPETSEPATTDSDPATSAPATTNPTVQPPMTAVTSSVPPAQTSSCKASGAAKRSLATPKNAKRAVSSRSTAPNHVSQSLRRKRAVLGKRSGFGCTFPSIGGLPLPSISSLEDLVTLF